MTRVINLFAGAGAGKSSAASQLFYMMKHDGYNVELVTEFAKELTWSRSQSLSCQPYVFGNQLIRLEILRDQVDYIITDSPILLSCIYNPSPPLTSLALHYHETFKNTNILLQRVKPYNPIGRNQSHEEAIQKDNEIKDFLDIHRISYLNCEGSPSGIQRYYDLFVKTNTTFPRPKPHISTNDFLSPNTSTQDVNDQNNEVFP